MVVTQRESLFGDEAQNVGLQLAIVGLKADGSRFKSVLTAAREKKDPVALSTEERAALVVEAENKAAAAREAHKNKGSLPGPMANIGASVRAGLSAILSRLQ